MGSDNAFDFDLAAADIIDRHAARLASLALAELGRQLVQVGALAYSFQLGADSIACGNCDATYFDAKWTPGCGVTPDEVKERNVEASYGFDCLCCGLRFEHAAGRLYDDEIEDGCGVGEVAS